nr:ribonuclease H-like domain-containing protein [Tanacetum cinerariifolium]
MVTQNQDGTHKTTQHLNLHVSHISHILKSSSLALSDPHWRNVMYYEYNVLIKNGTWVLVPRPFCANIERCLWLFRHKFHADGSLGRYKDRLVANGSSQQLGIYYDETFSPVVKPATIRTVLSLALTRHWHVHRLDVKNAFLNEDSFSLHKEFDMTYLGGLNYFLWIYVTRDTAGMFLSQKKYAMELLKRAHMLNYNPTWTPIDTESRLAILKRILRYVQGTLEFGLQLYASLGSSLMAYFDADWAGCPATRRSTFGYYGVANIVAETARLHNLLQELYTPLLTATLVYCDNALANLCNSRTVGFKGLHGITTAQ